MNLATYNTGVYLDDSLNVHMVFTSIATANTPQRVYYDYSNPLSTARTHFNYYINNFNSRALDFDGTSTYIGSNDVTNS